MSKYKVDEKDLRFSYSVSELETIVTRLYDLKDLYPENFRHKLKQRANSLIEEIETYLSKVVNIQENDQFSQSSKLSEAINEALDTVLEGYKEDFLVESKKVLSCPACGSINLVRKAIIGVNTLDVVETTDSKGDCLDCRCEVNL